MAVHRTVQILGAAPNLGSCPDIGAERWCANNPRAMRVKWPPSMQTWTRWFNIHSKEHMLRTYPDGYLWYGVQQKPIYLQQVQEDIPASIAFPYKDIIDFFGHSYFTFSGSWMMAFAIMEGFDYIELWGFQLRRDRQYDFERPCFFYWVDEARRRGIDVYIPPDVEITPAGDPHTYTGPLYGYQTTLPHFVD